MAAQSNDILHSHLDRFLQSRTPPKTFCPSEVARAVSVDELKALGFAGWRDAMPAIREMVWSRREDGSCEVLQRGEVLGHDIQLGDVRGPIRVRRRGDA